MTERPFFSILIPTRNRPAMLGLSLFSVANQNFKNFEVIISDNSDPEFREKNCAITQKYPSLNLRYVTPPQFLHMADNWEHALSYASGEYVGVLIDKTLYRQHTLSELHEFLKDNPTDIINFLHTGIEYHPSKIFKYKRQAGRASPFANGLIQSFNPHTELFRRFSLNKDIYQEKIDEYVLGKICFGFYHSHLIAKIKNKYQKLFHPLSCDYTSCALALSQAEKAVLFRKEFMFSINNFKGTGATAATEKEGTLNFLRTIDPALGFLNELPVSGLFRSLHNFCAYDYDILNRLAQSPYQINKQNLLYVCTDDLKRAPFSSEEEKQGQWKILSDYAAKENLSLAQDNESPEQPTSVLPQRIALLKNHLKKWILWFPKNYISLKSFLNKVRLL